MEAFMISSFPVLESTAHDQPLSIHNRLTQRVCAGPIRPKKIGTTPAETAAKNLVGKIRGGVLTPFPEKLHDILSKAKEEMFEHIVSWQPHGRCFIVHQPEQFVKQVMSRFFKQTKLRSFHRQLHLYGFSRLTEGRDRGGFYHEMFLRGQLHLCKRMTRVRAKSATCSTRAFPFKEPNFYKMEPCVEDCGQYNQPTVPMLVHQNSSWCDNFLYSVNAETHKEATDVTNIMSSVSPESYAALSFFARAPNLTPNDGTNNDDPDWCHNSEGVFDEYEFQPGEALMFEGKRFYFLDIEGS